LLIEYQEFLSDIDLLAAKAKYARKLNAVLPIINDERRLYFREAFHPILLLHNLEKKKSLFRKPLNCFRIIESL